MNAFCILFADNYGYDYSEVNEISHNRTLASIPFGGRYRLIDFVLSALVGANVYNIGLVTRNKYSSLMEHVGWGKDWDLNRKNGGLKFLTPFSGNEGTGIVNNKIEALNSVLEFIKTASADYCILSDSNVVMNIDLKKFMEYHEEKNADITFAYKNMMPKDRELEVTLNSDGKLVDTMYHKESIGVLADIQLNMVILKKDLLINLIEKGITYGWYSLKKNVIANSFDDYKIYGYKVDGYVSKIETIEDFYKTNMDLLNKDVRMELFHGKNHILTRIKDSVPTVYGENADVKNSLVADGSKVDGIIENCIIFRDVVIKKGAVVKNSIIMQGTTIEENAKLDCVITEVDVVVTKGKVLTGTDTMPFMINKGKIV